MDVKEGAFQRNLSIYSRKVGEGWAWKQTQEEQRKGVHSITELRNDDPDGMGLEGSGDRKDAGLSVLVTELAG